jgi:hypothetical protein
MSVDKVFQSAVSSDKSDDRCSETNDFGDDVYI